MLLECLDKCFIRWSGLVVDCGNFNARCNVKRADREIFINVNNLNAVQVDHVICNRGKDEK